MNKIRWGVLSTARIGVASMRVIDAMFTSSRQNRWITP